MEWLLFLMTVWVWMVVLSVVLFLLLAPDPEGRSLLERIWSCLRGWRGALPSAPRPELNI